MREIKFRFWDRSRQKFTDYGAIHKDGDLMARSATFGGLYDFADEEMEENIIIQQYTGLKDKNGVEIYEGDIILVIDAVSREQGVHEVKWVGIGWTRQILFTQVEVIGNIYENQELIDGKE